jgi:hypothetical protein
MGAVTVVWSWKTVYLAGETMVMKKGASLVLVLMGPVGSWKAPVQSRSNGKLPDGAGHVLHVAVGCCEQATETCRAGFIRSTVLSACLLLCQARFISASIRSCVGRTMLRYRDDRLMPYGTARRQQSR